MCIAPNIFVLDSLKGRVGLLLHFFFCSQNHRLYGVPTVWHVFLFLYVSDEFDFILRNQDEHIEPTSFITCMPYLEYAAKNNNKNNQNIN